ncbi:MAG: hypothetical protein ABF689_13990 [Gluconobacter cerinus]
MAFSKLDAVLPEQVERVVSALEEVVEALFPACAPPDPKAM